MAAKHGSTSKGWLRHALPLLPLALCPAPALAVDPASDLAALCEELRHGDLPYYGDARARALTEQIRSSPAPTIELGGQLGQELLQLGRVDAAIAVLEPALRAAREQADPNVRALLYSSLILAHLQAAEDLNCIAHGGATSCILPIGEGGVHRYTEHAGRAGDLALELLALKPRNFEIAWILNLSRMLAGRYPEGVPEGVRLPAEAFLSTTTLPPWRDRGMDLELDRVDLAGGAVVDDFDGDGLLDLVTSTWDPCASLAAHRNDGDGGFEEVTESWGLAGQLGGLNLVHADYDNDGRLDLLVLRGGWLFERGRIRNSLLRNVATEAGPRFVDVSRSAGLAEPAYPTQAAAWADYDGDGDLDLYVANERSTEAAYPSQLFRNNGGGTDNEVTFTDVAPRLGVENLRFAKGVAWGDFDDDGDPDLFVSNHGRNRLYRNDGDRFVDVADALGVAGPDGWTFGSWFFDYDNDGDLDLFVADYRATTEMVAASYFGVAVEAGHPFLYRNDGGRFTDVSTLLGFTRPLLPMGANYGDLDNDGWLDLYLGTGEPSFQSQVPNVMYRNRQGRDFADVTFAGGFGHLQKGHGVAFGDIDNDGDQDLLHQLGGFYPGDSFRNVLFENPGGGNWVTLRLVGRQANRFAIGARIELQVAGGSEDQATRSIHLLAGSGGSFGGSSLQQEIGLGTATEISALVVRWPGSGRRQRFENLAVNRTYRVEEGAEQPTVVASSPFALGGR